MNLCSILDKAQIQLGIGIKDSNYFQKNFKYVKNWVTFLSLLLSVLLEVKHKYGNSHPLKTFLLIIS